MGTDCASNKKDLAAMSEKQSIVTIGHNGLSFNISTADVLHRAAFVRVLFIAENGQFAV